MYRRNAFHRRPAVQNSRWLPTLVGAVAVAVEAAGLYALWVFVHDPNRVLYQAPSAIVLCALGAWQFAIAHRLWQPRTTVLPRFVSAWLVVQWLTVGAALAYFWALCLGPDDRAQFLFQAVAAAWYTVGLAAVCGEPRSVESWWNWLHSDWWRSGAVRFAARGVVLTVMVVAIAEVSVRVVDVAAGVDLTSAYVADSLKLPPGSVRQGKPINDLGYWDQEFEPSPRPGRFRIAVVGDQVTLSGSADTNCLEQLERQVPGIEVYNFGLPQASLREYAAQLAHDVTRHNPDLVLVVISVGDDITHGLPLPGKFDWRGLRLYQSLARTCGWRPSDTTIPLRPAADDYEAYLDTMAPRLRVCRTPIDSSTEAQWHDASEYLERLTRRCQKRDIPLALVLAPEEFQVSSIMCDALCRRLGYLREQVDVELPQRRLKALADQQHLPVLDLLPYFRASEAPLFARGDAGWSSEGNDVAVEVIGGWIRRSFGQTIAATAQASR